MYSTAVLASLLSAVSAYSICNPADVQGPIIIPINSVLVASQISVSGNIEIVNGCTFKVTGFNLVGSSSPKWYGGIGTSTVGITVSDGVVSSSGEQTFTFRNVVGSEVSFRDFDQFRLLDESTQTLIATAQVPSSVRANLTPGGTSTTGTNTTIGGTNTTIGGTNTTIGGTNMTNGTVGGTNTTSTTTGRPSATTTTKKVDATQPAESFAQGVEFSMFGFLLAFIF